MISREEALGLISEHITNRNIVKHMLATEALMAGVYDELKAPGRTDAELGGTREEWAMAGLLHDGDYCESVPVEKQGVQVAQWAREKGLSAGRQDYDVPENVVYAMAAHNWHNTKMEPKTLMDWALFLGDSLTGLVVASTLVLPTKKLADLTAENVLKRFKEPKFAAGTRREDILLCDGKLGLTLTEFVTIALKAMQGISQEIGL